MAPTKIVEVNLRMPSGIIHGPIQLRSVTDEDRIEMEWILGQALDQGLYNSNTRVLDYAALVGIDLYWEGLGARDRVDFEAISDIVMRGTLYWSNPLIWIEETDDLNSQCICQNETSCLICRLQKRVREAEAESYEAKQERAEAEERDESVRAWNNLVEEYAGMEADYKLTKDKMEILKRFVAEVTRENSKLSKKNSELGEEIRRLKHEAQNPIRPPQRCIAEPIEIISNELNEIDGNPLVHNINSDRHIYGNDDMIRRSMAPDGKAEFPKKLKNVDETNGEDVNLQSKSPHHYHGAFSPSSYQQDGRFLADKNSKYHGKSNKRKRADNESQDWEPQSKRHQHVMPTKGGLVKDEMNAASRSSKQKLNTSMRDEPENLQQSSKQCKYVTNLDYEIKQVGKPHSATNTELSDKMTVMHSSCHISDNTNNSRPKPCCSYATHPSRKTKDIMSPCQTVYAERYIIEKRRGKKRHHNSDGDDDNDDEDERCKSDVKRQRSLKVGTSSLEKDKVSTTFDNFISKPGRTTNNSRSSFLDDLGRATPQDIPEITNIIKTGRSTNNSLAQSLEISPTATIPNTSSTHMGVIPTLGQTSTVLPPARISQPTSAHTGNHKSTGWTDRERQAYVGLMDAHVNHTPESDRLYDVPLYEYISARLRQRHGINRSPGACKNEWNRRLREMTGIDERKIKNPRKLATSVQAVGS